MTQTFNHASVGSIDVQIVYAERELRVRVCDDGGGVQLNTFEQGHHLRFWAIMGMHERALGIGAWPDIRGVFGWGIKAELRVPASIAFRQGAREQRKQSPRGAL